MNMRRVLWTLAAVLSFAMGSAEAQQVQVTRDNRTIQVSATAEATAEADAATVHVGFQAYGPDADAAYAAGSKLSNAIIAALKSAGVKDDAIESDSQTLNEVPSFELNQVPEAQRAARHFRLQQSWTVKTTAKDAARVLDAAVKAGANQSGQVDWSMADPEALHAKAMEAAMAKARKNAEAIAAGMGVKLGILLSAANGALVRVDRLEQFSSLQKLTSEGPPPPPLALHARRISDSASVSAVYAIE